MLQTRTCSFLLLTLIAIAANSVHATSSPCTTILEISNSTFLTQVGYMRRGLSRRSAHSMYVRFIEQLSTLASKMPIENTFGAYCIPNTDLESQVDPTTNTLKSTILLEESIEKFDFSIPLLTHKKYPSIPENANAGATEWALTYPYFMESMKESVNASRIVFPEELSVLYDPHRNDSCVSFNSSLALAHSSTMPAHNLSEIMLSLVSVLINMGADPVKSFHLISHHAALTYVGTRCTLESEKVLQLPLSYMEVYGRLAGRLSKGNILVPKPGIKTSFLEDYGYEMVHVLSGFHSGGRVPKRIISSYGSVAEVQSDWACLADEFNAIEQMQSLLQKPLTLSEYTSYLSSSGAWSSPGVFRATLKSLSRPLKYWYKMIFAGRAEEDCSTGWVFISSATVVTDVLEQCCAEMCLSGSLEMQEPAAGDFRRGCCERCNEYFCPADETDDDLVDLISFNIVFPPYGQASNGSTPVMI